MADIKIKVKRPGGVIVCLVAMLASVVVVNGQTNGMASFDMGSGANSAALTDSAANSGFASRLRQAFSLDPVVDTGASPLGGRKVNVHVPGVFDLKLDTRANNQGLRMSQTVLGGLVSIFVDRTRNPTTNALTGPISVKVSGITMYQNEAARNFYAGPSMASA